MDCSLAIDMVALIVSIAALCVTIWIGITAQSFAKLRASKEDDASEKLDTNLTEIKEAVKDQSIEKFNTALDVAKEKIEKEFEDHVLKPVKNDVEEIKKEMNNLNSSIAELKNLTIKLD